MRVGVSRTTNGVLLVVVPPGPVMLIGPVVAPAGTVAVICVGLTTVNVAATPLKFTAVTPAKLSPKTMRLSLEMVMSAPTAPAVGEKPEMVGGRRTTKLAPLVAVPAGLVTVMGPVVAPAGTVAVICVLLLSVKTAVMPLKRTSVVPVKFVPVMVTEVPTGPAVGEKLEMVGDRMTTKSVLLVAVPAGLVTVMGPVVAPAGTVAVICVALLMVKAAATPLKRTSVVPVKFVPVMVTEAPTGPDAGEKLVMVGGRIKLALLVAVPAGLVTVMGPVVAPAGTVAVIWVLLLTVKVAATPLKRTSVVPVKFVPVMVTEAPMRPEVGEKLAMVGGRKTTKFVLLVAVPAGLVTVMGPVVAPAGTVAVICVLLLTVKVAATLLKRTSVVPVKFVPVMVTEVPTGPEVGEKLVMVGDRMTTKLVPLVAVPAGLVTVTGPVVEIGRAHV